MQNFSSLSLFIFLFSYTFHIRKPRGLLGNFCNPLPARQAFLWLFGPSCRSSRMVLSGFFLNPLSTDIFCRELKPRASPVSPTRFSIFPVDEIVPPRQSPLGNFFDQVGFLCQWLFSSYHRQTGSRAFRPSPVSSILVL